MKEYQHIFKTAAKPSHYKSREPESDGVEIHLLKEDLTDSNFRAFLTDSEITGIHLPMDRGGDGSDLYSIESVIYRREELFNFIKFIATLDIEYVVFHFDASPMSAQSDILEAGFKEVLDILKDKDVYLENGLPFELDGDKGKFCSYDEEERLEFIKKFRSMGFSNLYILLDIQHHHSYTQLLSIIENSTELATTKNIRGQLESISKYTKAAHISGYDSNLSLLNHGISLKETKYFADVIRVYLDILDSLEYIIYEVSEENYLYCKNAIDSRRVLENKKLGGDNDTTRESYERL